MARWCLENSSTGRSCSNCSWSHIIRLCGCTTPAADSDEMAEDPGSSFMGVTMLGGSVVELGAPASQSALSGTGGARSPCDCGSTLQYGARVHEYMSGKQCRVGGCQRLSQLALRIFLQQGVLVGLVPFARPCSWVVEPCRGTRCLIFGAYLRMDGG